MHTNQNPNKDSSFKNFSSIMKAFKWGLCLLILILISWSCYYDSEEYLYPKLNNTCDTTNVTYSASVKPILQQYCYTCHSNKNSVLGGSIKLEDYSDVKIKVDDGRLYGSIAQLPGYVAMPQGGSKLDDCSLLMIKTWIDSGAPNN